MTDKIKINWYRSKVDKDVMRPLMRSSDLRALRHVFLQLGLFALTATLAWLAFRQITPHTWKWALPLTLLALFVHGTFSGFLGLGGPVHELCHKTPFRTKWLNELFLRIYSFLSWSDYVAFRPSHVKHHQATVHADHDGEVVLPQKLDWDSARFFFNIFICDPALIVRRIRGVVISAFSRPQLGMFTEEWTKRILPKSNAALRREHRNWARILLFGQLALATFFIATGNWFLVIVINLAPFYCGWLTMLCGTPQHIGLSPNVPDFRLCCRTYTCNRFLGFLYWNMQHHIEHHMFPAVPFYHLPALRRAIQHDLPPAPHGLWETWREILAILKKQRQDPDYTFIPELPAPADAETTARA